MICNKKHCSSHLRVLSPFNLVAGQRKKGRKKERRNRETERKGDKKRRRELGGFGGRGLATGGEHAGDLAVGVWPQMEVGHVGCGKVGQQAHLA